MIDETRMNLYSDDQKQFVWDCRESGYKPFHYVGRNFYVGPATTVEDVSDSANITDVQTQSDNRGKRFVIYPKF